VLSQHGPSSAGTTCTPINALPAVMPAHKLAHRALQLSATHYTGSSLSPGQGLRLALKRFDRLAPCPLHSSPPLPRPSAADSPIDICHKPSAQQFKQTHRSGTAPASGCPCAYPAYGPTRGLSSVCCACPLVLTITLCITSMPRPSLLKSARKQHTVPACLLVPCLACCGAGCHPARLLVHTGSCTSAGEAGSAV
jgi:hypothetical protein